MKAALRRFMPRIPNSRNRRAALNNQNMPCLRRNSPRNTRKTRKNKKKKRILIILILLSSSVFSVYSVVNHLQFAVDGPVVLFRSRFSEEIAEAQQFHQAIAGVTADQKLGCHDEAKRFGKAEHVLHQAA